MIDPLPLQQNTLNSITVKLATGVVVSSCSVVMTWYVKKTYNEWENRGDEHDKLYRAMFGVEEIATMEGILDVVEAQDDEIESHDERITELEESMEDQQQRIKAVERRVEELRKKSNNRNQKDN